ncbi:hypothetical protein D9756_011312 [Leucocoprinus leucothites]|uniref:Uncharacterized protein n=1 Tax=Leucocoprinus leucothites TaxID=201217 RepID=A0A8H5CM77_9AGAR|nr:hypothetical protein D9756_011312 [Leucoagaricus leucothites]
MVGVGWEPRRAVDGDPERITTQRRRFNMQPQGRPPEPPEIGCSGSAPLLPLRPTLNPIISLGTQVEDRGIREGMNSSMTNFAGKRILMSPQDLVPGCYKPRKTYNNHCKPLDWATVEAVVVAEDGYITPNASVGAIHEIVQPTKNTIVKGNARIPNFEDLHGVYCSSAAPNYQPCVRYYPPFTMTVTPYKPHTHHDSNPQFVTHI